MKRVFRKSPNSNNIVPTKVIFKKINRRVPLMMILFKKMKSSCDIILIILCLIQIPNFMDKFFFPKKKNGSPAITGSIISLFISLKYLNSLLNLHKK
jgi:hypothetical protein